MQPSHSYCIIIGSSASGFTNIGHSVTDKHHFNVSYYNWSSVFSDSVFWLTTSWFQHYTGCGCKHAARQRRSFLQVTSSRVFIKFHFELLCSSTSKNLLIMFNQICHAVDGGKPRRASGILNYYVMGCGISHYFNIRMVRCSLSKGFTLPSTYSRPKSDIASTVSSADR